MRIIQKNDGSGEIHFSNEEIAILQKHKKLTLPIPFLKDFINLFMGLFFEMHKKMDKDTVMSATKRNKNIEVKEPDTKV